MLGVHFFEPVYPCEDKMSIKNLFHFWPLKIPVSRYSQSSLIGLYRPCTLVCIFEAVFPGILGLKAFSIFFVTFTDPWKKLEIMKSHKKFLSVLTYQNLHVSCVISSEVKQNWCRSLHAIAFYTFALLLNSYQNYVQNPWKGHRSSGKEGKRGGHYDFISVSYQIK